MDNDKTQELLLQLIQDMSYIKAKLDNIEEQKLASRIDALESLGREHAKTIKSLENRASTMEQFTRGNMSDSKKQMTTVYISMGMAIFSAIVSVVVSMIMK
jgi:hypothetical protein